MATNPKSVDLTLAPSGFTDYEIHSYSYSTGEDDDGAIQTIPFGNIDISSADSTSAEYAIALHSATGSPEGIKVWGKRKNFPGMTVYYGTQAALLAALGAAGTVSTIATTALPGKRSSGFALTFSSNVSERIIMQVAIDKETWLPFRDYDPTEDPLTKFLTLGFYFTEGTYSYWQNVAAGREDVPFAELYDIESNIVIDGYEIPMGHMEDGVEFTRDETTIEKKMLNPRVNVMTGRSEVTYMVSFSLQTVDNFIYSLVTGHDLAYDSTTNDSVITARDEVRKKSYNIIFRGCDNQNRMWEYDFTRAQLGQNGAITKHMSDATVLPVMVYGLADQAQDNAIYTCRRSAANAGIIYIDATCDVSTT